ncbi:MAG: putative quinol monooxygenase [Aquirufa sp.]|jgi:quinol monooxygenase YgiN
MKKVLLTSALVLLSLFANAQSLQVKDLASSVGSWEGNLTYLDYSSGKASKMYRIAKIKVDGNQLEKYKSALQEQMDAAIKLEPGVLSYTAVSDKKDPSVITIFEVYASPEAYQAHISAPHFKKYKETVKDMVLSLELIDTELVVRSEKADY